MKPEEIVFPASIPERLTYVQRKPETVEDYWEQELGVDPPKIRVRPTFVVDATNKKSLATAKKWAGTSGMTVKELPNDPIPVVELVTLEIRGQGGRAWKALVHGMFYVDLREVVLLECLKKSRVINKEIEGPFIWAVVAGHSKLVRVGSDLHRAISEAGERREAAPIEEKDLKIGGIYTTKAGKRSIFLGMVSTVDYEFKNSHGINGWITRKVVKKTQLWQDANHKNEFPPNFDEIYVWNIHTVAKKVVVVFEGMFPVPVPEDLIDRIREGRTRPAVISSPPRPRARATRSIPSSRLPPDGTSVGWGTPRSGRLRSGSSSWTSA